MPKSTTKPKVPKRLARTAEPARTQDLDDLFADTTYVEAADPNATARVSVVLAMAMLCDAMRPADMKRIARRNGLAVVVAVPGPDWVEPVAQALRRASDGDLVKRNGASRMQDKPDVGCEAVSEALGCGHNVLGVSNAPSRYLPGNLTALADIRVEIKAPTPRALRSTIRIVTGSRPGPIPRGTGAGLSFATLAGCIRRGSSGRACVRRIVAASKAMTTFDPGLADVPLIENCHGYGDTAMSWSRDLIAAVSEYRQGRRPWSSIEDRNIVLGGEAGVGKTSFARSIAKSLSVPFFSTSVSSWFASTGGHINEVVRQVDTVIGQAAAAGPAVLLLDEIDAIPNRATIDNRNRDYWTPIVSHILTALDSAVSGDSASLIIIGATNFPERLDEALVRPGRLNRSVRIERPDTAAIAGILRQHLGGDLATFDLAPIAAVGAGATGAEVAGWAKRARGAARSAGRPMIPTDLVAQVAPVETRSREEVLAVARHESSHAVLGHLTRAFEIESVSTVMTGPYAGLTRRRVRARSSFSRSELDDLAVVLLAGRAADALWGSVNSGSAGQPGSDLAAATKLVAAAHGSYGLGDTMVWLGTEDDAMSMVRTIPAFRLRVETDLALLQGRADRLVLEHADLIDKVALRLMRSRVLSGDEVRTIIARHFGVGGHYPEEARDA
ncbi:hypothetical protein QO001_006108 [Methylobacterium brachiatum]|uniref:AAA+ ATPase domain-containing protein n=1 Tax=Methylobacterium brachiatum TaxID=269660 RepID=A0AAJ1WZ28_9HYPH|nr:AAA family ATPase [Methylobacterium brachiatum]MCB4805879.1 AAA family ATPase [Methylobacterium brachiatum]MDQ0547152.1 hypothetical protein [Methylobacterium brachiatum]